MDNIRNFIAMKEGFIDGAKEIVPAYIKTDYEQKLFDSMIKQEEETIEFLEKLIKE